MQPSNDQPIIFLMGPTAIGKTALSIQLAHWLGAEIISVDSTLVYKGFDIGTAKPSMAERDGIVHHLIDVCDPWQPYSAARFCEDASALIDDIRGRGAVPLLTGGTMLYFNALQHGLADLPAADETVRAILAAEADEQGWPALHQQLGEIDPAAALRIHPNDPQRIQRALEVIRLSGRTLTELQAQRRSFLSVPPCKIAMLPQRRDWLHQRIALRFEQMLLQGFVDEVRRLRVEPRLEMNLPAVRSVGYRQAWQHLDACDCNTHESDESVSAKADQNTHWHDKAVAATRQLAKRQLTWMRGMNDAHPLECGEHVGTQLQMEQIQSHLQAQGYPRS